MAEDCPTGILLDLSEPIKLSPILAQSSNCWNSAPIDFKQFKDCAIDDQFESPSKEEENLNVSKEFDCDFIENETLNDLSACSTQSSSHSCDDVRPIIWSPEISKKTTRRAVKDDLSIGQRVEVFKEATSIAMHLENLSRGTPPPKPFGSQFTSPLLEKNLHNNIASNPKSRLESIFDLDISLRGGIENKRPNPETGNPNSFWPPLLAKPEARVQPILKTKMKEKEFTSETIAMTLRMNKNKAMAALASSSKQHAPMKAKKCSPAKQSAQQQKVIANIATRKTPQPNSKPASSIYTPLNDQSTIYKRVARVTRSSSFGAESLRVRRPSAVMSPSFSTCKPSIRSRTPDRLLCPSTSTKTNSKPVGRRSVGAVYSPPVQPFVSENLKPFVEPNSVNRSTIGLPSARLTPHKAPHLTPLTRSNSTSGDVPKKNVLPLKRRCSISCSSPKKTVLPTSKMLAARLRSSVLK